MPTNTHEYPVWSTLDSTSKYLFYVTAQEYPYPYNPVINQEIEKSELVQCKIKVSKGDNTTGKYPLKTKITLGYYQQTHKDRRMLSCEVEYSLYSSSASNFNYQL